MAKKESITKKMTPAMVEKFDSAQKMEAYADACKSKIFIKTSTIANAILASKFEYNALWKLISEEWPEFAGFEQTLRKDYTVLIESK